MMNEDNKIESARVFIKELAEKFGAKTEGDTSKSYIERNNTGPNALDDDGAYFGFIHPDEETKGPFHDFSLTIFPSKDREPWLVCLGIGSSGFKNDYELATYPGLRRLFSKLVNNDGFCKTDFSDIESSLPKSFTSKEELKHLKKTIQIYSKVLPVCQIVTNPLSEEGMKVMAAFVAGYAKLREWPTNGEHRTEVRKALSDFTQEKDCQDEESISQLLQERRYVVIQGPPGTGKTRMAKLVAQKMESAVVFTQFHAETAYSDFIYGILPDVSANELRYTATKGPFVNALEQARMNEEQSVVLIIDEINRANLSNVLGPVFYLFEHKMDESNIEIEIYPGFKIKKLPENFHVIATMNTADRSLAVVDFALRRRFAWYELKPHNIDSRTLTPPTSFYADDFNEFQQIFEWYASSSELALQPGQGYFLANSYDEMKNRIVYELLPLIREYLQEGLLRNAREEFQAYFKKRIGQSLFE